jgi:rhodanese-related sulfurtransferase
MNGSGDSYPDLRFLDKGFPSASLEIRETLSPWGRAASILRTNFFRFTTMSNNELGYAGDVTPETANEWMQSGAAVMVDVRTEAELAWVGFVPGAVPVPWKQWPGMGMNPVFDDAVKAAANGKKIVLLCRSGVRSIAAAKRATELGLEAYNILEGFEGDANADGHRGIQGGWRMRGLPWRQN